MTMPNNLVLVRHGQSEANVMQKASKAGNHKHYTDEVMTVPDRSWRLTAQGVTQAETAGDWIANQLPAFDRSIVSPFTRTRETAANLDLPNASWEENRTIRERSWGEIDSISKEEFRKNYPQNANLQAKDPLYWAPPAGESLANVSENRVRSILNTMHRENEGDNVLMVTHGEFIWATRLTLERWSDEEFMLRDSDENERIHNCMVVHYTRIDPNTGVQAAKLNWVRKAWPILVEKEIDGELIRKWEMHVGNWESFDRVYYTNDQLRLKVDLMAHWL